MNPVRTPSNMDNTDHRRARARQQFLADSDCAGATVIALAQDASFRRYFRVAKPGRSLLLMDAPAPFEDTRPFLRIDEHLRSLGLLAPEIMAHDVVNGFLLLEDFGDDTFTRLLSGGHDPWHLYRLAVDVLIELNTAPDAVNVEAPPYDTGALLTEAALLPDWYYPLVHGVTIDAGERDAYLDIWQRALTDMPAPATTLVLRDFHVDNLMLVHRDGVERCGLLDFQDALIGPSAYDLASLLQDARRDIDVDFESSFVEYFLEHMPLLDRSVFLAWYSLLAAQRHAKVLGIFSRLCLRDGKCHYLGHLSRVAGLLERGLALPALTPLADWMNRLFPGRLESMTYHIPEKTT